MDCDRAVIGERDLHMGTEHADLNIKGGRRRPGALDQESEFRSGKLRSHRIVEGWTAALTGIARHREVGNKKEAWLVAGGGVGREIDKTEVHLSCRILEDAEVDELVGEPRTVRGPILGLDADEGDQAAADARDSLVIDPDLGMGHSLDDGTHQGRVPTMDRRRRCARYTRGMNLSELQVYMRRERIDAWLLYDFRGSNFVLSRLLPGKRWTTRRVYLVVRADGPPAVLVHGIDAAQFQSVTLAGQGVKPKVYLTWPQIGEDLKELLAGCSRIAMEYAPGCSLPVVSIADAGTVEMVRALGFEVVSSANLVQHAIARWSPEALKLHWDASASVTEIKDQAFGMIRDALAESRTVHEHDVQAFIMKRFAEEGLETADEPIVAVNAHAGDPHYGPSATKPTPIRKGDWVLIDLWARRPGEENIFSDITWVGFAGQEVPAKHRDVFNAVRLARDASLARAVDGWKRKETVQGWQLDDAARNTLIDAGYEKFIRHRTGHSLSQGPAVHGLGMNLDNLETHDTREMLPGLGFTIEPGLYLPEFGVRLEINIYADPAKGPVVTSCVQDEVVLLG
jgi:Xaa-Pro dipeptidase